MKISLITVTYNAEKFLADCIESVLMQDYPEIEHIIVDGKSTDGTLSILKKYDDKIAAWSSETDRGMYDAINKGIRMATGDIVGILNSDDMLASPGVISKIAAAFENKNVDSVYGDLEYVDQENTDKVYRVWKGKPYRRSLFNTGWMPAHPTFYVRMSKIMELGGYETHYFTASDYEFMARYLFLNHVSSNYIPSLIVRMRRGGASNKNIPQRLRANRRDYLAMKRNKIPLPFLVSVLKPLSKLHQFSLSSINVFSF